MSEQDAFLAAIIANPADDVARLVYADWLDEHGDADRARFIRVQIARAGGANPLDLSEEELEKEEKALLEAHYFDWTEGWEPNKYYPGLRRGFIGKVSLAANCPEFLQNIANVRRLAPIEEVRLNGLNRTNPGAVLGHADCRDFLRNLRVLDMSATHAGPRTIQGLAEHMQLMPSLEELYLSYNDMTCRDLEVISQHAQHFSSLRMLDLKDNLLHGNGVRALAQRAREFAKLEHLDLSENGIANDGMEALAQFAENFTALRVLNVQNNTCTNAGIEALTRGVFPELVEISVGSSNNPVQQEAFVAALRRARDAQLADPAIPVSCPKLTSINGKALDKFNPPIPAGEEVEALRHTQMRSIEEIAKGTPRLQRQD